MRPLILIALLAATTQWGSAQRMGGGAPPAHFAAGSRYGMPGRSSFFPASWLASPFYTGDPYMNGYPVSAQPPMIFMQGPAPTAKANDQPQTPAQPLMIELQGDRYVRVSSIATAREEGPSTLTADSAEPDLDSSKIHSTRVAPNTAENHRKQVTASDAIGIIATPRSDAHELTPALLVFRDGQHEEVRDYTIADGVLYARGDYWTDGYWNKKVELSRLNLPATYKANDERGVKFVLPSGPNEVITRF